jgi:hypothetical protein
MSNKTILAASRVKKEATHVTAQADRLIDYREVNAAIGSRCRTAHTARNLARRGLIKSVRFNERVIRYSERSVRALVEGGVS